MKKISFIMMFITCYASDKVNAQCTTPWCTTGNTINSGDVLGGDNSNTLPLYIQTNGTTRVTVAGGSNNVGIGTTSPNNFLQINGGSAQITNSTTGTGAGDGFLIGQSGSGSSNLELNQQENAPINFLTNGNARFKIQNDGKIFMGPYTAFSANNQLVQYAGANTSVYHQFLMSNTVTSATDGFRIGITYNSGSADAELRQGANAPMNFLTNGTQRMTISNAGDVGIGTTSPSALFHVEKAYSSGSNYLSKLYLTNSGAGCLNYGSDIYMSSTGSGSTVTGQFIFASGLSDNNVIGGYYTAGVGASNYGLILSAQQGGNDYGLFAQAQYGSGDVYGVWAEATNDDNSGDLQGVHAEANDDGGTHSTVYGIYAALVGSSGSCSSPYNITDCPKAAGYFSGDVVYSGSIYGTSDSKLKDNVASLQNASAILTQLMPKSFTYKTTDFPSMNLSKGTHYGLIAQDVENGLPEIVKMQRQPAIKDTLGNIITPLVDYKSVNYIELIAILIQGFKEQQQQLMDIQIQLDNCCGVPKGNKLNDEKTGAIDIKLINTDNFILYQNEPNPYTTSTTIRYFIPENVSDVKITFQDASGKNLKEIKLNATGQGSIAVDGNELNNGLYTYSLVINGKVVDVKKMVKQ